jgi:iron complex outermembrane receptor protein
MAFVSSQYLGSTTDANPQTIEPGYALLGARLTLADPRAGWSLALFGNNLTNTAYSLGRFNQVLDAALGLRNGVFPGSTAIRRIHGEPRTWGISFLRRWS